MINFQKNKYYISPLDKAGCKFHFQNDKNHQFTVNIN